MSRTRFPLRPCLSALITMLASALFSSCASDPSPRRQVAGAFGDLPNIQLINPGSSRTPPHRMSMSEYPFDAAGNYIPGVAR